MGIKTDQKNHYQGSKLSQNLSPQNPSPKDLHKEFVRLGRERRKITYELLALLPEIYRQEIYKKQGYTTIYEYAGKIAGLSDYVIDKTLRLEKHLDNKPYLQQAVMTQGIHKVDIVARLATPETDKIWADKVENMSKESLQELRKEVIQKGIVVGTGEIIEMSKEIETKENLKLEFVNAEFENGNKNNSTNLFDAQFCNAGTQKITIELDNEMLFLFFKAKKKIGENLSNKEALRQLLKRYENLIKEENLNSLTIKSTHKNPSTGAKKEENIGISQTPDKFSQIQNVTHQQSNIILQSQKITSQPPNITRYIPIAQKRISLSQTKNHCAYPNCPRPPEIFHHRERFADNKNHDTVIPVCKIHHEFAHNGIIDDDKNIPENWKYKIIPLEEQNLHSTNTDIMYRKFRKQ